MKQNILLPLLILFHSAGLSQIGKIQLEFNSLKMGYWNDAEQTIKLEDDIRTIKSQIVIEGHLIYVTLTKPNKTTKMEVYHWVSHKVVTQKGYSWIEYTLKPSKEGEAFPILGQC